MADQRTAQLNLLIKEAGAKETAAEIQKISTATASVQKELAKFSRTEQLRQLGSEMGVLAKKTNDVSGAVTALGKKLQALGASKDEIREVAQAFNEAQQRDIGDIAGGRGPNFLQRAGTGLRNLPSVQIPGAGFGTDAVGNLTRLSGAIVEIAGKSSLATGAANLLTPAIGAQAAATLAAAAPVAGLVAGFAAIAVALSALVNATNQNVDKINTFAESQRTLSDKIVDGLTSEQAQSELDKINKRRAEEEKTLKTLETAYGESAQQLYQATVAGVRVGNAFGNVARIFSADEQALVDQIAASQKVLTDTEGDHSALTAALEDGSLAANDAAEAEKKLAEERSKAALTAADNEGKQLAAEQRALNATEEQNRKRLDTITDEEAVLQRQIETLETSGVTSEEVTAKIAALKDQLGLLGKESEFINETALEASRAADAEKKVKKDAEDAAKKAEQAQEQYTNAVKSAATSYKQSLQDIGTRFTQTLSDNQLKFDRDLTDIATKYRRDEFDLTIKANRAERDAYQDQINEIADIRRDANKEEQEALRDGDFKALFLAREKQSETLQEEQKTIDMSRQQRVQDQQDAREDLLRAAQRQRSDRMLNNERTLTDARTANSRELQQARLTQQRALQAAAEANNASLNQLNTYLQSRLKLEQQYYGQSLNMAGAGPRGGADALRGPQAQAFSFMTQVIRK